MGKHIKAQLFLYLESVKALPFEWGRMDCALFCAGWFETLKGYNPIEKSIGQYTDRYGAIKHEKTTYNKMEEFLDKLCQNKNVNDMAIGDIAFCGVNCDDALGIVGEGGMIFFKGKPTGVIAKKNVEVKKVWAII